MSIKFLPFVTEATKPDGIFKALIQRSKDVSDEVIYTVYSAILDKGITNVKKFVSTLPDEFSTNEVYKELLIQYSIYSCGHDYLNFWRYVVMNHGYGDITHSDLFALSEISLMVCAISNYCPEYLEEINFKYDAKVLVEASNEDFDVDVKDLHKIKFSDEGIRVGFFSFIEFKAFSVTSVFKNYSGEHTIKPVKLTAYSGSDVYGLNSCLSPYVSEGNDESLPL